MRTHRLFSIASGLALVLVTACGDDGNSGSDANHNLDAPAGDSTPATPTVIAGGGIGGGPVDGVVNLYAIDDVTRQPITGAAVAVGSAGGVTDATGLFVAHGIHGKQTVLVTAAGYRSEMWVGANGANMTMDLQKAVLAPPASAKLTGTVDLSSFTVLPGHLRVAEATYSQDDKASDGTNNLDQGGSNVCFVLAAGSSSCSLTVTSRTGNVALVAAVFDDDENGTPTNGSDDVFTLIGWAFRTGITVTAGSDQTGQSYTIVGSGDTLTEHINFNDPPANLPDQFGIVGVDLGSAGVLQLPDLFPASQSEVLLPQLHVFPSGATYQLTAIAEGSSGASASVQLVRAQTGQTLTAGTWLLPPTSVSVTRSSATWSAVTGALAQGVSISSGSTQILNVTAFDGSTTITFPAAAGVPATGTLTAQVTAIAATDFDVTNFSLDADRDKIIAETSEPAQVAN